MIPIPNLLRDCWFPFVQPKVTSNVSGLGLGGRQMLKRKVLFGWLTRTKKIFSFRHFARAAYGALFWIIWGVGRLVNIFRKF